MTSPEFPTPVPGDDPCGPDLRWDPEFMRLMDAMAAAVTETPAAVLEAEAARPEQQTFEEILAMAARLSERTKDVRVLAVHAEASWCDGGLAAFAEAMEAMAAVLEAWPGPADGVHPRADEEDGDLGERAAVLGRLLKRVPALAATVGWGAGADREGKVRGSATLRNLFGRWRERLEAAFGPDLPSPTDAWRALEGLVVAEDTPGGLGTPAESMSGEGEGAEALVPAPPLDAWDLIDRTVEQMVRQDRHSPALPILQLLAGWRSLDIVDIADAMKQSGISLEQLLESVKKQIRPPS